MTQETPRTKDDIAGYTSSYDDLPRFSSYLTQLESIRATGCQRILEIGKGNGTVAALLRIHNFDITTLDYDERLNPDITGDVRKLPCEDASYDLVSCCEVLEHLPFSDSQRALSEIHRTTRKHAIISIPYSCLRMECALRLQDRVTSLRLRIPTFFLRPRPNSEHVWEMGRRGFSKRRIRHTIMDAGFTILNECSPMLNPWHYFFILEKKHGN